MTNAAALRQQVRQRAKQACEFCGVTEMDSGGELTIDHFRPLSRGGSDNIDEEAQQHRQTHDLEAFLGSDIYAALQKRKSKRESIIKKEAMNKALTEREEALNRIKEN